MARPRAILRTPRLLMRPYAEGDAEPLAAAIGHYDVARWLGRVPYPYGVNDARAFISTASGRPGREWLIEHEGRLAGGLSVDQELGYWFARDFWGRALATEACDAATDAFFADRKAERLISSHFEDNPRSATVLQKQGFRYTGCTNSVRSAALSQIVTSREMVLERAVWASRRRYRLTTPRLRLRELRDADLSALIRTAADPRVAPMLRSVPTPWPVAAARAWLETARFRGRIGFHVAICRWRRMIGALGVTRAPDDGPVRCSLFIDPADWGKGFATEALTAFGSDIAERFGVTDLWAEPFADNAAAAAVLRRVGFVRVGSGRATSAARVGVHPTDLYRRDPGAAPAP